MPDGKFEPETVNALVDQRLRTMAEALQRFGKDDNHKNQESAKTNDVP
jgi:hypothetical protein